MLKKDLEKKQMYFVNPLCCDINNQIWNCTYINKSDIKLGNMKLHALCELEPTVKLYFYWLSLLSILVCTSQDVLHVIIHSSVITMCDQVRTSDKEED